jgi:hypothetical protein
MAGRRIAGFADFLVKNNDILLPTFLKPMWNQSLTAAQVFVLGDDSEPSFNLIKY